MEAALLMATAVWPCNQPSEAMLAAYASDPALAAMRLDFIEVMRRTVEVTVSGILARQEDPTSAPADDYASSTAMVTAPRGTTNSPAARGCSTR